MKITMYELLGMVKDGKAPNTILYENETYWYDKVEKDYYKMIAKDLDDEDIEYLFEYSIGEKLNEEVLIITERPISKLYINNKLQYDLEEEKKIPEKLKSLNNVGNAPNLVEFADKQQLNNHLLKDKLNEVIHYLQYLKSKGDE